MDRGYALRSSSVKATPSRRRVLHTSGGNNNSDHENISAGEEQYDFQRGTTSPVTRTSSSNNGNNSMTKTTSSTMRSSSTNDSAFDTTRTPSYNSNAAVSQTPIIQRTLYTRDEEELDDDDDDDYVDDDGEGDGDSDDSNDDTDDNDDEMLDDDDSDAYVAVGSSSLFHRHYDEGDDDDDDNDLSTNDLAVRRHRASLHTSSTSNSDRAVMQSTGFFARVMNTRFFKRVSASPRGRALTQHLQRLFHFVLRHAFAAVNIVWLFTPLLCFGLALVVPQYLTTAIRYVDVFTTRVSGSQSTINALREPAMRLLVHEIVDSKLSAMTDELTLLRAALDAQTQETHALRELHATLRQAVDMQQRTFSLADANSALAIHVERIVTHHTDDLWSRVVEKTATIESKVQTTAAQQATLYDTMQQHAAEMTSIRTLAGTSSSNGDVTTSSKHTDALFAATQRDMREELSSWKSALKRELQHNVQHELQAVEERLSQSLFAEKHRVVESVERLQHANVADPALVSLIDRALVAADAKRTGRVDFAALANGARVIYTKHDLLQSDGFAPLQTLARVVGFSSSDTSDAFTSRSYCSAPLPLVGSLLSSSDVPWWLSRHNGRPETALSETMEIGSCWGVAGASGRLSIKFATRIIADAITIDHILERVASDFRSAPKDFAVVGLVRDETRDAVDRMPLGNFTYVRGGASSQTFALPSSFSQRTAIDGITLEIRSNYGHDAFTCLYRVRVHGTPPV